jgi:hypothetical protein
MSDREGAIFVIVSHKDQTIKDALLKEKENIMTALNFHKHVEDLDFDREPRDPGEYFDHVFFHYEIYYDKYNINPGIFEHKKIFDIKKGQSFLAIFTVNSAGCWEHLQVLPLVTSGVSNIKYYTQRETIEMPS